MQYVYLIDERKREMFVELKKLLVVICIVFPLVGCFSSGPSSTLENFTKHVANGELEKAGDYATASTMKLIGMASAFGKLPIDPNFEFHLINEEINNNNAVVAFKNGVNGKLQKMNLVKLNGKWKVHAKK